jgi:competence protein ComEC
MPIFDKIKQNKKIVFLIFVILLIISVFGYLYYRYYEIQSHTFRVTFLDVGQGDAALIQFENGEKMLVDCGASKIVLSALGRNLPFYDRTIDYVLATHPDLDHYGGCLDVVKNYHVKEIITNGHGKPADPYWREWDRIMQASGAELKTIAGHEWWSIASTSLEFLSPDINLKMSTSSADSNNFSIVFHLTHNNETFLFTGDMEAPLEKVLVEKYCSSTPDLTLPSPVRRGESISFSSQEKAGMRCTTLQSDTLKVGHHGSDGASSELFLSYVKPKTAVISVGPNKYGHPTLRAIRHLERAGAKIMRTDGIGDIVLP